MREYKTIDRWIDLDKLPRNKRGQIAWIKSCGIRVPFQYGDIIGEIEILEYIGNHKYKVAVYANNKIKIYSMSSSLISACDFGGVLRQSIGETNPELIKYFVNTEDAFIYSKHCRKSIDMICPICGFQKQYPVELLTRYGFSCPRCSDGKSWAEKFMFNILTQLNINFKNEVTKKEPGFEWAQNYRYDFYIKLNNYNLLIEMDGHFHDGSKFYTYDEVHEIDIKKDTLALENGFKVIRIDCRYPDIPQRFEYIKQKILESDLCNFLNLSAINWQTANQHSLGSYIKQAADLFVLKTSVTDISKMLKLSKATINKYLKIATEIGWCNYVVINGKPLDVVKPLALYKDDQIVGVFISAGELDRKSNYLYGVHLNSSNVHAACNDINQRKHVKGYIPKYITYQEYMQLLPQFSTIQNELQYLKEVC